MKSEDIFNSVTKIDDDIIEEAANFSFTKRKNKLIPVIISAAAVFAVIIALGALAVNTDFIKLFSPAPQTETTAGEEGTTAGENEFTTSEASVSSVDPSTEEATGENSENTESSSPSEEITTERPDENTEPPYINPHIPEHKTEIKPMSLVKADYPEMAKYPSSGFFLGGMWNDKAYEAWQDDIRKMNSKEVNTSALNTFTKALLPELLTGQNDRNKAVSPLNLYMALAIVAETCDGNSRKQILSLLGENSIESLRENASALWQKNYRDDGSMKSILASSLWLNNTVEFKKNTINSIAENYFASVYYGTTGSESFNRMMNSWIKEQTDGLFEPDLELDAETVAAIVSTLLFNTKWNDEFSEEYTTKDTFHSPSGDKTVSFMNASRYMTYYWGENFCAIKLGLDIGGRMWFILPDEGVDADRIFSDKEVLELITLDNITVDVNYKNSKYLKVNMSIPKFDIASENDVTDNLKKLGITDVMNSKTADFSPLAKNPEGICLDKIIHGVRVKIDEEGVAAAAYTAMMLNGSSAPPDDEVDFVLSRPFAFVITMTESAPLFAGVVNTIQ